MRPISKPTTSFELFPLLTTTYGPFKYILQMPSDYGIMFLIKEGICHFKQKKNVLTVNKLNQHLTSTGEIKSRAGLNLYVEHVNLKDSRSIMKSIEKKCAQGAENIIKLGKMLDLNKSLMPLDMNVLAVQKRNEFFLQ